MKYLSVGQFAEAIGKTQQTVRNWSKNNTLKPDHIAKSGYRYYTQDQVAKYLGRTNLTKEFNFRKIVGYCRVSTQKQKDNLDRQIECVKTYA